MSKITLKDKLQALIAKSYKEYMAQERRVCSMEDYQEFLKTWDYMPFAKLMAENEDRHYSEEASFQQVIFCSVCGHRVYNLLEGKPGDDWYHYRCLGEEDKKPTKLSDLQDDTEKINPFKQAAIRNRNEFEEWKKLKKEGKL